MNLIKLCTVPLLLLCMQLSYGQVVINEIASDGSIELLNIGDTTVDVGDLWLCNFPVYIQISDLTPICGRPSIAAGDFFAVEAPFSNFDAEDGEAGLYATSNFGDPTAILDYVEWGAPGHQRASVAAAAGIWDSAVATPSIPNDSSLSYNGEGETAADWFITESTLCEPNPVCTAEGGEIFGGPFEFTVGDGIADMIPAGSITLEGNEGTNSQWVITDEAGTILGLPGMPSMVDFEEAGPGTCLVWHLSFEDGIVGAEVGLSALDLVGCFSLSNSIEVVRTEEEVCEANGGEIFGGPFEFTVGDGIADMIPAGAITLEGNEGTNSQWVITDPAGNILGLPGMPSMVDFEDAGTGTCLIWHLSFEDGIQGAEIGANANDLEGCFNLSNNIVVVRNEVEVCEANGGQITGGPFEFIVGDGIADMIPAGAITLTGNEGSNSQWVITDEAGTILGLPGMPSMVDFEEAGPGTCLVWHLSFEDGIMGAEVGLSALDLEGCFNLSNSISVVRTEVEVCEADGGQITGGPFEFIVGDGIDDMIPAGAITLTGNEGSNSQWVITDEAGMILGLPGMPSMVNFEGAGPGTCLVWHLSFEDGIMGAEVGLSALDLEGCFNLSNPISVVRTEVEVCEADGGQITGGPFEFTVGDGIADMIPAGAITLTGNEGSNSQWVITDEAGMILGLPGMPSMVNFEGAGPGTCLVWHLSFEDGIMGAEVGLSALDLEGCFNLSNPISVVRTEVEVCEADGGHITGGPFEFTVGDGIADMIPQGSIHLSGNQGTNSQWVITDEAGTILGLPGMPSMVDFEGAGPGTCLIWHLSYEDGIMGAEVGLSALDLEGCFSLSNSIQVIRTEDQGGLCVQKFYLLDAHANTVLFEITDGMEIDLATLPTNQFSIQAVTTNDVESVYLKLSGAMHVPKVENYAPYTLYGDNTSTGDIAGTHLRTGHYYLKAIPYSKDHLRGHRGKTLSINFSVVDNVAEPAVESFTVVNAWNNHDVHDPLLDGDVINGTKISIRANANELTESVYFVLRNSHGTKIYSKIENYEPFSLFGDSHGNYAGANFGNGVYILEAYPYSKDHARGVRGAVFSVTFRIDNHKNLGQTFDKDVVFNVTNEKVDELQNVDVSIFPNPIIGSQFNIELNGAFENEVNITVFDPVGRIIYNQDIPGNEVMHQVNLNQEHIPGGMLVVRLLSEGASPKVFKVLKN